ncbi:hypothetical protein K503DRAFT_800435 [Rhizopogon vinicolor AM-OR11-026]|uniref:Uncharacterized protein n=1 Tax=Rhizopogon vinicolor AM-OR11-026 TaxID=1314800 RepID=A0A1B7N0V6_9AGAM|nr:hypothetical protein K503DRAFT_800435 [Rhizopogon vinicolor AM-OR11-026]
MGANRHSAGSRRRRLCHLLVSERSPPFGPTLQHEDYVLGAAISADGKLLVTGCYDSNAYIWDIHTILKDAGLEELLSLPDVPQNGLEQKVQSTEEASRKSLIDPSDYFHSSLLPSLTEPSQVDATDLFALPQGDENPYDNFFPSSSQSPLDRKRRWWNFPNFSVPRPPVDECGVRWQERLKHGFRGLSRSSVAAPANDKPIDPTPKWNVGGGDNSVECDKDVDGPRNNDKGKDRQVLTAGAETSPPDDPPAPHDNDHNAKPGTRPHSSARRRPALSSSSASRPHDIVIRFFLPLRRPQPNADESMELIHNPGSTTSRHQHSPHPVLVAPMRDREALYVSPQPKRVSEQVKRIRKPTWWACCILFICCVCDAGVGTDGAHDSSD